MSIYGLHYLTHMALLESADEFESLIWQLYTHAENQPNFEQVKEKWQRAMQLVPPIIKDVKS